MVERVDIKGKSQEALVIKYGGQELVVEPERQFDLLEATIEGLDTALVRAELGSNLRNEFDREMEVYADSLESDGGISYGTWVYYPEVRELVHFAPKKWHRLALVASNSSLYLDGERKLDWEEIRDKFDSAVPAVVGLSVGSNIGKAIIADIRPDNILISDPNLFKVTNANRVLGLTYKDLVLAKSELPKALERGSFLQTKVDVFFRNVASLDPYINIHTYPRVDRGNVQAFLAEGKGKPKATTIIDVCDSPEVKVELAEEARRQRIPLVRATDAGSTVRIDTIRYDKNPNAPLAFGVTDDEIYSLMRKADSSRANFYEFASALIGKDCFERDDEFAAISRGEIKKHFTSIPQLGSTAMIAGGMVAGLVARMILGYKFPERYVIDFKNLDIKKEGEMV
jgi:molybdopterin/thiamine biosynthesis adenylyltransferase